MSFKARHIWLFEKINHYLRLGGLEVVEDEFRPSGGGASNYDTLESFLRKHGSRTLFVYATTVSTTHIVNDEDRKISESPRYHHIQNIRHLECTAEFPKNLKSNEGRKVVYFVRQSTETGLNPLIADDDSVDCGVIQSTAMESLETMLTAMVHPALDIRESWGSCGAVSSTSFKRSMQDYMKVLQDSLKTINGGLTLTSSSSSSSSKSSPSPKRTVNLVREWIESTRRFLSSSSSGEHQKIVPIQGCWEESLPGPETDIEFWTRRYQRLCLARDQIQSASTKEVLRRISNSLKTTTTTTSLKKSMTVTENLEDETVLPPPSPQQWIPGPLERSQLKKLLQEWRALSDDLSSALNQAKDITDHLKKFEPYVVDMSKEPITKLTDVMRPMMNTLARIHMRSEHFSATGSNRLVNLMKKITNRLVSRCKETLNEGQDNSLIWNQDPTILVEKIENCLRLYEAYQDAYREARDALLTKPRERQFEFSETDVFDRYHRLCERLVCLLDMFSTSMQYRDLRLGSGTVVMREIGRRFEVSLNLFRDEEHDILDFESTHASRFDKDFKNFQENTVVPLEKELMSTVHAAFENTVSSIADSLRLLKRLRNVLRRDDFARVLNKRLRVIFNHYARDLDIVETIYERDKETPIMERDAPPITGHILWSRRFVQRVREPMEMFQDMAPELLLEHDSKKVVKQFNKILKVLLTYEYVWFQAWCRTIKDAASGLDATLLVRARMNSSNENSQIVEEEYTVNFDSNLLRLTREAQFLSRLDFVLPSLASKILVQATRLKLYRDQLKHLLEEWNRVRDKIIPHMRNMFRSHLHHVETRFRPGLVTLTWASPSIENFRKDVTDTIQWFDQLVSECNRIFDRNISINLKQIRQVELFCPQNRGTISLDTFVATQRKLASKGAELFASKTSQVENETRNIMRLALHATAPCGKTFLTNHTDTIEHVMQCRSYISNLNYEALRGAVDSALRSMKNRMCDRLSSGSFLPLHGNRMPFFSIDVQLVVPHVRMNPSLDAVQRSVNQAAKSIVQSLSNVYMWVQDESEVRKSLLSSSSLSSSSSSDKTYFDPIASDIAIVRTCLSLTGGIHAMREEVQIFLDSFSHLSWLWTQDIQNAHRTYLETNHNRDITIGMHERELLKYMKIETEIGRIPSSHIVGSIALNLHNFKLQLRSLCRQWRVQFASTIRKEASTRLQALLSYIKISESTLKNDIMSVHSVEKLRDLLNLLKEIYRRDAAIEADIVPIHDLYKMLSAYLPSGHIDETELSNQAELKAKWKHLVKVGNDIERRLEPSREKFRKRLLEDVKTFKVEVLAYRSDFDLEGPMRPGLDASEALKKLTKYRNLFKKVKAKMIQLCSIEEMFSMKPTSYPDLDMCESKMIRFGKLYDLFRDTRSLFEEFRECNWSELSNHLVRTQSSVDVLRQRAHDLDQDLQKWPAYRETLSEIKGFEMLSPILDQLSSEAFRLRHWERLNEIVLVGKITNVDVTRVFQVKDIVGSCRFFLSRASSNDNDDDEKKNEKKKEISNAQRLVSKVKFVSSLCTMSLREANIESRIMDMKHKWTTREFEFKRQSRSKTDMISNFQSLEGGIEDATLDLQSMLSRKCATPFVASITTQLEQLSNALSVINLWFSTQEILLSLEPVFRDVVTSTSSSLREARNRFQHVLRHWSFVMSRAKESRNVLKTCLDESISSALPSLHRELERCTRTLRDYLASKRKKCPRLAMMSDSMLLRMLSLCSSSSSDNVTKSLSQYVSVVFMGVVSEILYSLDSTKIEGLVLSGSKRHSLMFVTPILFQNESVEQTIQELIDRTQDIILNNCIQCIKNCAKVSNDEQSLILRSEIEQIASVSVRALWTGDMTRAIECNKTAVRAVRDKYNRMYRTMIDSQDRSRCTESLISLLSHKLQVIDRVLSSSEEDAFVWLKQIRLEHNLQEKKLSVHVANECLPYRCDILDSNACCLVVTPLTERVLLSLAFASRRLSQGVHLLGNAGVGKTETTNLVARMCGTSIWHISCPTLGRRDFERVLIGLQGSNVWGVLHDLARVKSAETSSYINLLLQSMPSVPNLFVKSTTGVGKSKDLLPCLQRRFRPYYVERPSLCPLIQTLLLAYGYSKNEDSVSNMTSKVSCLIENMIAYKMISKHDLRPLFRILRATRRNKKNIRRCVRNCFLPQMESIAASQRLEQLVDEIFDIAQQQEQEEEKENKSIRQKVRGAVRAVLSSQDLEDPEHFVERVCDLHDALRRSHSVIVTGQSFSGKSIAIQAVREATDLLAEVDIFHNERASPRSRRHSTIKLSVSENEKYDLRHDQDEEPDIRECRLYPGSFEIPELYGYWDLQGEEWKDGIVGSVWKTFNHPDREDRGRSEWFVFDGEMDRSWVSPMLDLIDSSRNSSRAVLSLPNGDAYTLADGNRVIVETCESRSIHPGILSRAPVICFGGKHQIKWRTILKSCMSRAEELFSQSDKDDLILTGDFLEHRLRVLRDSLLFFLLGDDETQSVFDFVNGLKSQYVTSLKNTQLRTVMHLLTEMLVRVDLSISDVDVSAEIERVVLWSLAWGLGGSLDTEDRARLDTFLTNLRPDNVPDQEKRKDEGVTIFDFFIDPETVEWEPLVTVAWSYPENVTLLDESALFVPTRDTTRVRYVLDVLTNRRYQGSGQNGVLSESAVGSRIPVALVGPQSSGKTALWSHLLETYKDSKFKTQQIVLSHSSQVDDVRYAFTSRLRSRGGGTIGPERGEEILFFVDDMTLVTSNDNDESLGRSSEMLRELMERHTLNDSGTTWNLQDVHVCAALRPVSARKRTSRLVRHFDLVGLTSCDDSRAKTIFEQHLSYCFPSEDEKKPSPLFKVSKRIVSATLDISRAIRSESRSRKLSSYVLSSELSPSSSYVYTRNMPWQDLHRIIRSLMISPMCSSCHNNNISSDDEGVVKTNRRAELLRQWRHECLVVFNKNSEQWVQKCVDKHITELFSKQKLDDESSTTKRNKKLSGWCMPSGFLKKERKVKAVWTLDFEKHSTLKMKSYENIKLIRECLNRVLKANENIVLFDEMCRDVAKILRRLGQCTGLGNHACLISSPGGGKRTLCDVVSRVMGWRLLSFSSQDFVKLCEDVGLRREKKMCLVVLDDDDLKNSNLLNMLNSFIGSGIVPSRLREDNTRSEIERKMIELDDRVTGSSAFKLFCDRVRDNIRVVFCLTHKSASRLFDTHQGLERGTEVFILPTMWSERAINHVASQRLGKEDIASESVGLFGEIHRLALSVQQDHTTVRSFETFLTSFSRFRDSTLQHLKERSDQNEMCVQGMKKIRDKLGNLEKDLKRTQDSISSEDQSNAELMIAMQDKAMVIKVEEEKLSLASIKLDEMRAKIHEKEDQVNRDLISSMPHVETAQKSIEAISAKEVNELRKMANPNEMIKLVVDCMLILLNEPVKPVEEAEIVIGYGIDRAKIVFLADSYLLGRRGIISEKTFLSTLFAFAEERRDHINDETLELLEPYFTLPNFNPDQVGRFSPMSKCVLTWVREMIEYRKRSKHVQPEIEALQFKRDELEHDIKSRGILESTHRTLCKELEQLQKQFGDIMQQKRRSEQRCEILRDSILNLKRLVNLFEVDGKKWCESNVRCESLSSCVFGDSVLAGACVAYAGFMNTQTRDNFFQNIKNVLKKHKILFGDHQMLMRQHTDKIREKFILKSNTAMQSASIALCQSNHRVPVLVDPSGTAFQWLRTWLPKSSFASVLNKDIHSILRFVRDAMQEGRTIVLHDVEDIHLIPEPERARVEDSSLISLLKSLLEKEIVTQSELQFFKTSNGEEWDFNDSFRIFVLCSNANPKFSSKAIARSACVQFNLEETELCCLLRESAMKILRIARYDLLRSAYQDFYAISTHVEDAQQTSRDRFVQASAKDTDCVVVEAIKAREELLQLESQLNDANNLSCDMEKESKEFQELASRVATICLLANRLESSLKRRGNGVDLEGFKDAFERALCDFKEELLHEDKKDDAERKVLQRCFEFCARRLRESDRNALAVMLSLRLCKIDSDLISVFLKIQGGEGMNVQEEECPYKWLSQDSWSALNRLERLCDFFEELIENICTHEESWRSYYESKQPDQLKLPVPYDKMTQDEADLSMMFRRVMLLHAMRPDRTTESLKSLMRVNSFVLTFSFDERRCGDMSSKKNEEEREGDDDDNDDKILSLFDTAHNATVILIQDASSMDPSDLIVEMSKHRGVSSKIMSVCGNMQAELSALRSWSSTSKATQRCLILQNAHLNTTLLLEAERVLREHSESLREKHLWILLDEKEANEIRVPRRLYSVCNVLSTTSTNYSHTVDGPLHTMSVRDRAKMLTNYLSSSSKHAQKACLLHAAVTERAKHDLFSYGWNTTSSIRVGHYDMMASLEILSSSSSLNYLELLLETIAFGRLSSSRDRVILRSLIRNVLLISDNENKEMICDTRGTRLVASRMLLTALSSMMIDCEPTKKKEGEEEEEKQVEDELQYTRVLEDLKHYVRDVISKYEDSLFQIHSTLEKKFGAQPLQFVYLKETEMLANTVEITKHDLEHVLDVLDNDASFDENTKSIFCSISRGQVPECWLTNSCFSRRHVDLRSFLDELNHRKRQLQSWYKILSRPRRLLPSKDRETVFDAVRVPRSIHMQYLERPKALLAALCESVYIAVRASGQASSENFALNDVELRFDTTRFLKLENVPVHEQRTIPDVLFHVYADSMSLLGAFWSRDATLTTNEEDCYRSFPLLVMTFRDRSPEALIQKVEKKPWHPPPANTVSIDKCRDEDSDVDQKIGDDDKKDDSTYDAPIFFFDGKEMHPLGRIPLETSESSSSSSEWVFRGGVRVVCKKSGWY